jgi:hypothetical protein
MFGDWFFWVSGSLLGLGGLVLLGWSLFADRARGCRRCPKCWYDMSGTDSLTCPECGHTVRRPRSLRKTRRRWRYVLLAIVILLGSPALDLTPKIHRDGWPSVLPTTVLILIQHYEYTPRVDGELLARFMWIDEEGKIHTDTERFADWQWSLLADAAVKVLLDENADWEQKEHAAYNLRHAAEHGVTAPERFTDVIIQAIKKADYSEAWEGLVQRLGDDDYVRWLHDDRDEVYRALLRRIPTATLGLECRYTSYAFVYADRTRATSDLLEIIPTIENEDVAVWATDYFIREFPQNSSREGWQDLVEDQVFLSGMIDWLSVEPKRLRNLSQLYIWDLAFVDKQRVRAALAEARESARSQSERTEIDKAIKLVERTSEKFRFRLLSEGELTEQLSILRQVWQTDPEFFEFCVQEFIDQDNNWRSSAAENHWKWLNAVHDSEFTTAYLSALVAVSPHTVDHMAAAELAGRLAAPTPGIIDLLDRLSVDSDERVRAAAREALAKIHEKMPETEQDDSD